MPAKKPPVYLSVYIVTHFGFLVYGSVARSKADAYAEQHGSEYQPCYVVRLDLEGGDSTIVARFPEDTSGRNDDDERAAGDSAS